MPLNRPKINVNWLLFLLAIALGVGAVYLSNSLLKNRMAEIEAEAKRGKQMIEVVVARKDLQRGDAITGDAVAIRAVPKEYVHHSAITPEQFAQVENQRLAGPLKRGETVLTAHTEGAGAGVFSAMLRKGSRALTFEVDAVNSISGMLRPGDRIDLIYSARVDANSGGPEITKPLMSNVTVLATDQNLTKRDDGTGKSRSFSTITLEVSPLDADRIIVAKSSGRLTAVLRHPDDDKPNTTSHLTAANLMGKDTSGDGNLVEYIVGGGTGGPAKVQFERATAPQTANAQGR